jgi:hypothetical protein
MDLTDFQRRLLGFPAQMFGGQAIPPAQPMSPVDDQQQQDMQQASTQRLGQLGMLLMAAGQRMTPKERATILAQAPQYMDGVQRDAMTAAQARLMNMQGRAAQDELSRTEALRQKFNDPNYLNSIGLTPEQAQALGPSGIQKLLENQALANTPEAALDRKFKQAQIDHLLNPSLGNPQMVDLPGGGKGWAYPGKADVLPIGGAGKGGTDPEMAKRTEAEDKNLTYAKEAITAHRTLSDPSISGDLTSGWKNRVNKIPTLEGSWAGEKYLTGDSQANSFVDSVVRPRSGAVVGPSEMADKKRIFTPMPGDSQDRLFQKAQQRAEHIKSLIAGANPADRPMLQKMFEDSQQELLQAYSGNSPAPQASQSSLPTGVRSITPIE